jgi:hypothetical protein
MVVLEDAWPERYEWLEDGLTPEQALILLSLLQENGELLIELLEAFVQEATGKPSPTLTVVNQDDDEEEEPDAD